MKPDYHPVIELIKNRTAEGSKPGNRNKNDHFKLGLAIEGGGMRGVVSAGMVTAIEYLNCLDAFDVVYGSSAGAVNGAYLISSQAAMGTTIYYENINNNSFIDIKRLFSKKSIMSLEFLLDQVAIYDKKLDLDSILASKVLLKIIASDIFNLCAVVFDKYKDGKDLIEALRASARIPLIGGKPVVINGNSFLDALLFESIPFKSASKDECTHILTLCTRPRGILRGSPSFFEKLIVAPELARINPALKSIYLGRANDYFIDIESLIKCLEHPDIKYNDKSYIYSVFLPEGVKSVGRLELDRATLVKGAKEGMKAAMKAITGKEPNITEVIFPFEKNGRIPKVNC